MFVVSFISATLLPMGSEPVVFGLVKLNPELFWPAVLVATAGNTLGGALDWWLGYGANKVAGKYKHSSQHNRPGWHNGRRLRFGLRKFEGAVVRIKG